MAEAQILTRLLTPFEIDKPFQSEIIANASGEDPTFPTQNPSLKLNSNNLGDRSDRLTNDSIFAYSQARRKRKPLWELSAILTWADTNGKI